MWLILFVIFIVSTLSAAWFIAKINELKDEIQRTRSIVVMLLDNSDEQADIIDRQKQEIFDANRERDDMKIVMGIFNREFG